MRGLQVLVTVLLAAGAARASPYWVAYEGNDLPENEGWERVTGAGGGQRSIEDGWFVLDTRASISIVDWYEKRLNGALDPGPGETFVMQWRLLIDELQGNHDPTISVRSDENWIVGLAFSADRVVSFFEYPLGYTFEPGIPHTYELRSEDMRTYCLYVDDVPALEGSFKLKAEGSRVAWGDGVQGSASLTKWDYVRFGTVPEPAPLITCILGIVCLHCRGGVRG